MSINDRFATLDLNDITVTAAQLNTAGGVSGGSAGVATALKAVILDGSKAIDEVNTAKLVITSAVAYAIDIQTSGLFRMGTQTNPLPLTSALPYGLDVQVEALTALVAGDTGVSCGIHSRYEIDFDQTNAIGFIAVEGQLRVKKNLVDGAHAGIRGYVEVDGSPALGSTSTTTLAAGHFSLELAAGTTVTDDLWLCGVIVDANVESAINVSACKFVGIRIKKTSGSLNWEEGLNIADATNAIVIGATVTVATDGYALKLGTSSTHLTSGTADSSVIKIYADIT